MTSSSKRTNSLHIWYLPSNNIKPNSLPMSTNSKRNIPILTSKKSSLFWNSYKTMLKWLRISFKRNKKNTSKTPWKTNVLNFNWLLLMAAITKSIFPKLRMWRFYKSLWLNCLRNSRSKGNKKRNSWRNLLFYQSRTKI